MNFIKNLNLKTSGLYLFLGFVILLSYSSLIWSDSLLSYDDVMLLTPIRNLHSFSDYFNQLAAGNILDLSPVRDLSWYIDFQLKDLIPLYGFHLMNAILLFGICFLFKKILDYFNSDSSKNQGLIWTLVFFFALSPVTASSVSWVSARKHLLATFFILWSTFLFLKNRDKNYNWRTFSSIVVLFLLSTLSQPINLLWPLFVFAFSYHDKKIKERVGILSVLFAISTVLIIANQFYYSTEYVKWSMNTGKYSQDFGIGLSFLALGRYFYQALFPFDALPVSHFQGAWQNLVGLGLAALCCLYLYRKRNFLFAVCGLYFLIPLIPVTVKVTRIFCSDTYLLNASIGLYLLIFLLSKDGAFKRSHLFIGAYALILFPINFNYIRLFQDTYKIWEYSYSKEPNTLSLAGLATRSIQQQNMSQAKSYINELAALEPEYKFLSKLQSDVIYYDSKLSSEEKIKQLQELPDKKPISLFQLALLHSNAGNKEEFQQDVFEFLSRPQEYINYAYMNNEEMLALLKTACERNKIGSECAKRHNEFNKVVTYKNWNQDNFDKYYRVDSSHPENLKLE
ncbi:MAG: hypothetical protein ACXVAX_05450 [Pseudobdellovibrio sp.]